MLFFVIVISYLLILFFNNITSGVDVEFDKSAYYENESIFITLKPYGLIPTTLLHIYSENNTDLSNQIKNQSPSYIYVNSMIFSNKDTPHIIIIYKNNAVLFDNNYIIKEIYIPYYKKYDFSDNKVNTIENKTNQIFNTINICTDNSLLYSIFKS